VDEKWEAKMENSRVVNRNKRKQEYGGNVEGIRAVGGREGIWVLHVRRGF
jgi:hypothetical protein